MDMGTFESLGLKSEIIPFTNQLVDASGNNMSIIGSTMVNISIRGHILSQEIKILNSKTYRNVILGRDFLSKFESVAFDFTKHRVKLGNNWHYCVKISKSCNVALINDIELPARTESVVAVKCNQSLALLTADFEPFLVTHGVYATRCRIIPNIKGVFQITLLNVNNTSCMINSEKKIGSLIAVEETVASVDTLDSDLSVNLDQNIVYGENLSVNEKEKISTLISQYSDIFAQNPKKPKVVTNMHHHIVTNDALPIKRKPYRLPHAWNSEIDKQIQEMLQNDIIRPSSSPWNSPIILVKKKDGSMRFVCDFRGLNDVSKKDSYPLPHIRDVIDRMHGTQFWTTLDAASAYWSMPLNESDKEKTAFSVPRGKYEFNVTPFGLCNAGASYQRMIDMSLSGLDSDRILAYMDDIVVFSKTFEDHVVSIEQLFARLRESGISLKLSKCIFASDKVDFLGFELSRTGIKPQTRLTESIESYKRPTTKKELRGFLGLAGFYRAFIPNFADISAPLNGLTNDNVPFIWTDMCEEAFVQLKMKLTSEPILKFPDLNQPFVVEVDASNYAVGGILSQKGSDEQLHPVAYFSTALQKAQKNWSATNKEAFALVLAVRHWNVYLAGSTFVLNSDHNPLTHLRDQQDPRGKVGRWISELEEYDYTIKYIRGAENVKADALSRNENASQNQPHSQFEEKVYALFAENASFLTQLKEEQQKDATISSSLKEISANNKILQGRLRRVQKQLRVEEGLLTKSGRPVIPPSLRKIIVKEYHNIAHFGIDKIYSLLKDRFYWPNMYAYVQSFISSCETCQRTKCDTAPPKAPMVEMFIPSAPMQFISLDIAYLPRDNSGYQYILLIGDIFSKFISAVPLKDQTAPIIVDALLKNWIFIHGTPFYILSDQGSNVDGNIMQEICTTLGIEKRRSSAYHSQGNGFAERNIRSVKDMLRAVLLHRQLQQSKWRSILGSLVFALNTTISKATKCVPYEVVFGRPAVLPQDIIFGTTPDEFEHTSASDHLHAVSSSLNDVFEQVMSSLALSKKTMQRHYNKNIRFNDYKEGQKVWLKNKHYKSGENRKLAPRRNGPWFVLRKLPNGVNFRIENSRKEQKVVHHDRLLPFIERDAELMSDEEPNQIELSEEELSVVSESSSESSASDYEEDLQDELNQQLQEDIVARRNYPRRNRRVRELPDAIPWNVINI